MIRIAGFAALVALAGCSEAPEVVAPDQEVAQGAPNEAAKDASFGTGGVTTRMATSRPDQPQSECGAGEQTIFSCTMKSGKQASVCVAGDGAARFAQYRFGPANSAAELVWPASAEAGQLAFKSVPYSGGGEAQLSFTRGDTTYVVFSRVIRTNFAPGEPNNPAIEDGIMVLRGDTVLGELACSADVETPINYDLAEKYGEPAEVMFYAGE